MRKLTPEQKERQRAYYLANREKVIARVSKYRLENIDRIKASKAQARKKRSPEEKDLEREYHRAYRAMKGDSLCEKKKEYYAQNKEHFKVWHAQYRVKNNDYLRAYDKARRAAEPEKKRALDKAYNEKNKASIKEKRSTYFKAYALKNKEHNRQYREDNKDSIKTRQLNYYAKNKPAYFARVIKRNAQKIMAVPKWADLSAIEDVYAEAIYMQMDVDHIIPLQSKLVCGLHVVDNLQLLPRSENRSKGNRHWPDMPT